MDPPFVQDREDFLRPHVPFHRRNLGQRGVYVQENIYIISTGHFGSACMKARPYGLVTMRLSRMTMMPWSLLVRIKRPTPCRSFRIASGNEYSVNGSPPRLDQFEFRFDERMIGHGKRQARN